MGVTGPLPPPPSGAPAPGPPPAPYWKVSRLTAPEARASVTSQIAVYLVSIFAIGLVAHTGGGYDVGVAVAVVLALGIVVGTTTRAGSWFTNAPGLVVGIVLAGAGFTAGALASAALGIGSWAAPVIGVVALGLGIFVTGLDWTKVARLRAVPVMAGLPVLAVSFSDEGPMLPVSLAWLALAVASLWSLELDQRAAFAHPRALDPGSGPGDDVGSRDLAGALGLALLIGLLFAFSASMPSCSLNIPGMDRFHVDGPDVGGRRLPFDGPLSLENLRFGNFPFDFSGDLPSIDIGGIEHFLREGASGILYLENALTGEWLELRREGENLVARDAEGNVVAVIRPEEEKPSSEGGEWWQTALVVVAVLAVVGLAVWLWRRRRRPPDDPKEWAEDVVKRIDRYGRAHRTPRARSETVVHHTDALAATVAPDLRLVEVGRVLSDALFGRSAPSAERRAWVEQVLDEVAEAHPPPSRLRRRREARETTASASSPAPPTINAP